MYRIESGKQGRIVLLYGCVCLYFLFLNGSNKVGGQFRTLMTFQQLLLGSVLLKQKRYQFGNNDRGKVIESRKHGEQRANCEACRQHAEHAQKVPEV